jgi:predicted transcriptional regulator
MLAQDGRVRELVAEVAAAYFQNSHVAITEIPQVISQIATSLTAIPSDAAEEETSTATPEERPKVTASQIRRSVRPDVLISFEDGRPYRTLTRHLAARGLTPAAYRDKWGLPPDYPMVAADYSAARASMARKLGLGQRGLAARAAAAQARSAPRASAPPAAAAEAPSPAAASRTKKAAPRRRRRSSSAG